MPQYTNTDHCVGNTPDPQHFYTDNGGQMNDLSRHVLASMKNRIKGLRGFAGPFSTTIYWTIISRGSVYILLSILDSWIKQTILGNRQSLIFLIPVVSNMFDSYFDVHNHPFDPSSPQQPFNILFFDMAACRNGGASFSLCPNKETQF